MSTNAKNVVRPDYFRNHTIKIKERYILVEKGNSDFRDINERIANICESTNVIIQELNLLITERQLPYIRLKTCYGDVFNKRVRVFLHNNDTDLFYEKSIQEKIECVDDLSHILDVLIARSFKKITISSLSCDAEIVIDFNLLECAIVDIILDVAMFNSYSFLKNMTNEEKKHFSKLKYRFFEENKLPCFYDCDEEKEMYYSLAFSARQDKAQIDLKSYISNWDKFIDTYYKGKEHKEKSIKEQIRQHVDFEELPKNLYQKFDELEPGAYLILRTNKDRTEKLHPQVCALFGMKKYQKGKIKIVPISEHETYEPLFVNLDVSVFKIVKQ